MSKDKKVVKLGKIATAEPFSDEDIETWAYYFSGRPQEEEDVNTVKSMAHRVANIGDVTAIARFFDSENKEEITAQLNMIVQRMTIMEYIITDKLGVSNDEMLEYAKKYEKEMDDLRAEMERLTKESVEEEETDL